MSQAAGPKIRTLALLLFMLLVAGAARPQKSEAGTAHGGDDAPGAPGTDAHWPSAAKNGFGTSNTIESKIWFTLSQGALTEVYYPTLDVPNTNSLQFIIVSPDGRRVELESEDTIHRLERPDSHSLLFRQVNTARGGDYTITKTYATDPQRPTLLIDVRFRSRSRGEPYSLYLYYDPSLNNSGMHDSAWTEGDALLATDREIASALVSSSGFMETSNRYSGASDGLSELRAGARVKNYERAGDGNVVQLARVDTRTPLTLALGFGRNATEAKANARASLGKGFARASLEYSSGWHRYLSPLFKIGPAYRRELDLAAMVLKALEDKTYSGAFIASPSIPWGGGPSANEPTVSGYHAVWARDLYHVATGFMALGDRASAARALDYLFQVQQRPDGTFPQNSRVNGRPIGGALQLDQTAYPLILAYQLGRTDARTWEQHVRPAVESLLRLGPRTEQERWEEKAGYSPSTIAAEIAGLVCAAEIARRNGDDAARSRYLAKADQWAAAVEHWTSTTSGRYSDGNYYLRITDNADPNDGAQVEINSGGGTYDEREIVDAGFLELVRLGIKRADDPLVQKSLAVVDELIKVQTPHGACWYRYNHDAYGETPDGGDYDARTGVGRLWTLLAGERGEYELARGRRLEARKHLDAMMSFANDGGMIAEQVWDRERSPRASLSFGAGTGSATPLAWSMAQFVRLAVNLEKGRNLETPDIVAARYAQRGACAARSR